MNNKYFKAFDLEDADITKFKFPLLIWSDIEKENKIILLTEKGEERIVCDKGGDSIQDIIKRFDGDYDCFLEDANQGDESQHVFKLVDFDNGVVNWDSLIEEYKTKISKLPHKEGEFEKEILEELNNNYIQDVKASLMECIYNSIVFNMHALSIELNIESIGFLGELSYQERFRQIIHKNLNSDFNVILGN